MSASEYLKDLMKHRALVAEHMLTIVAELNKRAVHHDDSKFDLEEYDAYEEAFPNLQKYAYGSEEHRAELRKIKPAIEHHYQNNRHHPEYFGNVGIAGMNLLDLIEMVCDWVAASQRKGSQTDLLKSLQINKTRFDIDDQLFLIIMNTVEYLIKCDEGGEVIEGE
jgi:hypothetical protein